MSDPARRRLEFTPFHGHLAKKCSDTRRRHPSAADTERLQKAIDWYYTRWAEGGSAACPVNPGHSDIGVFLKAEVTLPLGESADPATLGGSAEVKLGPARECSLVPFSFKVGRRRSDPPPPACWEAGCNPPPRQGCHKSLPQGSYLERLQKAALGWPNKGPGMSGFF